MKQIFFIFSMMIVTVTIAQRSQEAYSMTIKTASEVRAAHLLEELNKKIILTSEQKEKLGDIIRYYLDEYQNILQRENPGEALIKLNAYRDKIAKKILNNEDYFNEFISSMEHIRKVQQGGYGRR